MRLLRSATHAIEHNGRRKEKLILIGKTPNAQNIANGTRVVRAVKRGDLDTLKNILARDLSAAKFRNSYAMRLAAGEGRTNMVQLLLDSGANLLACDGEMYSLCLYHDETDSGLMTLITKNDERNSCPQKLSAYWFAVAGGRTETLKFLFSRGEPYHGELNMMLIRAAQMGLTETVAILLDHGADAWGFGNEAICSAAAYDYFEIVKLLIDHGANPRYKSEEPLSQATRYGAANTVKLLLELGADVHARKNEEILSNATYYITSSDAKYYSDSAETIKLLVEYGADARFNNDIFLHEAAAAGKTKTVEALLSCGCDIHSYRDLALRLAARNGNDETVKLLLYYGADVHAANDAAIKSALAKKYYSTAKILKNAGADCPKDLISIVESAQRNASVAVVYFDTKHGRYLIIRSASNSWTLPQTCIEPGETELCAATRILASTTGTNATEFDHGLIRLGKFNYHKVTRYNQNENRDITIFLFKTNRTLRINTLIHRLKSEKGHMSSKNYEFKYTIPFIAGEMANLLEFDIFLVLNCAFNTQAFRAALRNEE
jgi:ankyrin repeat protein